MRVLLAKPLSWPAIPKLLDQYALLCSCHLDQGATESEGTVVELLLLLELIQFDKQRRYPSNWKRLAWECKDRAGWQCQRCGIRHGQIRWSLRTNRAYPVWLHAHHINADPANPVP